MTPGVLRWRYSRDTARHYYEDKRVGYGYVDKRDDGYLASVPYTHGGGTFDTLRAAKNYVQDQVLAKKAKRRKTTPRRGGAT